MKNNKTIFNLSFTKNNVKFSAEFKELCHILQEFKLGGKSIKSLPKLKPQNLDLLIKVFNWVFKQDNAETLNSLFEAGLPIDYLIDRPGYVHNNIASFAVAYKAINCLKLLQSLNFNFCTKDSLIDEENHLHYSIRKDSIQMTKFFAEIYLQHMENITHIRHTPEKQIDPIKREGGKRSPFDINAWHSGHSTLHLALWQGQAEVADYVLTLPFERELYYADNEAGESPIMFATTSQSIDCAIKIIDKFDDLQHYQALENNIQLFLDRNYQLVDQHAVLKEIIDIRREKLLLNSQAPASPKSQNVDNKDNKLPKTTHKI